MACWQRAATKQKRLAVYCLNLLDPASRLMAMLPAGILASAALLLGLVAGGWAGWLARGRRPVAQGKMVAGFEGRGIADISCLWDPHGCLNALNRSIISAPPSSPLAEDNSLYAVSDHLRLLAQLSQSGGWVSSASLQEWLEALVALQPGAPASGVCSVALPENRVQRLQILPLGMALLPLLRQAKPVAGVLIEASDIRLPGDTEQTASLALRLRVSEGRKADAPQGDQPARPPREWDVELVCECTVAH